jgi:uncharacterized HhH-GPD family protein
MPGPESLPFTEDDDANRLLATNPLALLIGMLLDQQFPMERAFRAPHLLQKRLGGALDAVEISSMDEDDLIEVFREPPALHRFPGSMAKRTRAMCEVVANEYDGDPCSIWSTAADGRELLQRLEALPGYGKAKARIFVGIVGKRLGTGPEASESVAADWPSIADVDTFEKVFELREHKRAMKAANKVGA